MEADVAHSSACWDKVLPSPEDSPSQAVEKREQLERLAQALEQLPENERDAITARDLLGLSVEEVADRMGRSMPAIAGLLVRGRRRLRDLIGVTERKSDETS